MKKIVVLIILLCAVLPCSKLYEIKTREALSPQRIKEKMPLSSFSEIVYNMGYNDVEKEPFEVVELKIPETFSKVYERYNELQKKGGYDLSPYKGKNCTRYTYRIESLNARANIIVCGGKIIGGDISGITIDSIMIPLKKEYETKKKIKPSV